VANLIEKNDKAINFDMFYIKTLKKTFLTMFNNFSTFTQNPQYAPKIILFALLILFFYSLESNQQEEIAIAHFNTTDQKLIVNGYDLVSYFYGDKPVKGNPSITSRYRGLLFYFSSQDNKDLFISDPLRYLPKYGGWCAYAIGDYGKKVDIDPLSYTVENGELYLFYKSYFNDTREKWIKNHETLKQNAEVNWQKIIH
jgi:YHS domain-containing protein